jgi:hypothetical protein
MLLGIQMKLARVSQQRTKTTPPLPNGKARTTKMDKIPFREVALSLCSAEQLLYQCRAQHHDNLYQPLGRKYLIECSHHRRPEGGTATAIFRNTCRSSCSASRRQAAEIPPAERPRDSLLVVLRRSPARRSCGKKRHRGRGNPESSSPMLRPRARPLQSGLYLRGISACRY